MEEKKQFLRFRKIFLAGYMICLSTAVLLILNRAIQLVHAYIPSVA